MRPNVSIFGSLPEMLSNSFPGSADDLKHLDKVMANYNSMQDELVGNVVWQDVLKMLWYEYNRQARSTHLARLYSRWNTLRAEAERERLDIS